MTSEIGALSSFIEVSLEPQLMTILQSEYYIHGKVAIFSRTSLHINIFCFVEAGIFAAVERCRRVKTGDTLSDITDGIVYQELVAGGFLLNISFQFNTDGVPVFKSSSFSFWPLHLNKLTPKKRYAYVHLYNPF